MGFKVVFCTIASVFVVSILIAVGLGSKKLLVDEGKGQSLIKSQVKDEDVAELLWVRCRLELMRADEVVENLNFHVPEKKSGNKNDITWNSRMLTELDRNKLLRTLQNNVEQTLLDCLSNRNLLFPFYGEDGVSKNWFTFFLDLVNITPARRHLVQTVAGAPDQSPAVSPTQSPSSIEIPGPPLLPQSPNVLPTATKQSTSGPKFSNQQSQKKKNSGKTVLIAVVATAGATFVLSAILFLCCRRVCGTGSGMGRNDERPLLSLSLSDYSNAYSQKSVELNSKSDLEKKDSSRTFGMDSNHNKTPGDIYLDSHTDSSINIPVGSIAGVANTSFDNSASGMLAAHGLLPLKPPPGRATSTISTAGTGRGAPPPAPAPPTPPLPRPAAPAAPMPPPLPLKSSFAGPLTSAGPPPPPPPAPKGSKTAPRPPPPPGGGVPPPQPPPTGLKPPRPSAGGFGNSEEDDAGAPKTKLKPFFWDKVLANPEQSMVWHQIKAGSFQFDEDMIESLFGCAPAGKTKNVSKGSSSQDSANQYIQIIDAKKSQNLSILLKALNVTTAEVVDALQEGNELPSELIQTLIRMAPTTDEELKLRLYSGELSRLGTADRFLKVLVDIPFAFKRLEALHFMSILQDEETTLKESFSILEAACNKLRKSRLFLKLLEAVLKTGNRMNDGTFRGKAQAFKLDTLLKLSDVKGIDGKTTLLHFVVQEIIRSEGIRAVRAVRESRSSLSNINSDELLEDFSHDTEEHYRTIGLQVVSELGNELESVKRAAVLDADSITGTVSKLGHALMRAQDLLNSEMKDVDNESGFHQTLTSFVQNAGINIHWLLEEEKRIMALVKSTGDYFHGHSAKDEGLRLFVVVRDFLIILEKVCKDVKVAPINPNRPPAKAQTTAGPSKLQQPPSPDPSQPSKPHQPPSPDPLQPLKPQQPPPPPPPPGPPQSRKPQQTPPPDPPQPPKPQNTPSSDPPQPPKQQQIPPAPPQPPKPRNTPSSDPPQPPKPQQIPPAPPQPSKHHPPPSADPQQLVFSAIRHRRMDDSSSDDDSP